VKRARDLRQLAVWMNGERVGSWRIGAGGVHAFAYAASWLYAAAARPLSLSLPLRSAPYSGALVEAFFDNLLPDSPAIRQRLQSRFGAASQRAFDLLAEVGRDCVGAVQLLPDDVAPAPIDRIEGEPMREADVAALLRRTPALAGLGREDQDDLRISLAGAQEKTALLWHDGGWQRPLGTTPSTHIFKLPLGRVGNMQADFASSVENEWLCAQLLRAFGLPVAECRIAQFEEQKALVVQRFDRRLARAGTHWLRLPQEDFCQATGTPPAFKYEADGGPAIVQGMQLLLGSAQADVDRETFFKAQLLFWLLCATDGHAKNFSLHIEAGGRYRLAPLYDVLSAHAVLGKGRNQLAPERARMAMAAHSTNRHYLWKRILPRHWDATAHRCGFPPERAPALREALAAQAPAAVEQVTQELPKGFPADLAERVLAGIVAAAKLLRGAT
jgi:serine/threonine-protein kinase HipA